MRHLNDELIPLWEAAKELSISQKQLKMNLRSRGYDVIEMNAKRAYLRRKDWEAFLAEIGLEAKPGA